MRKNNCEAIRQELDELMLNEARSADVTEHLKECAACREFQDKQTKLRQMVGSLGTVSAPADFDFRLRARLANESSNAGSSWNFAYITARRGFAMAAMLLVFVTGVVLVRNVWNKPAANDQFATGKQPAVPAPPALAPDQKPVVNEKPAVDHQTTENSGGEVLTANPVKRPLIVRNDRPSPSASKIKRPLATEDFSSEGAGVIRGAEPAGAFAAFPLDASLQSFKVSLDDGRGNARTISVPTVSFGSQRTLQPGNQFAQKRDW